MTTKLGRCTAEDCAAPALWLPARTRLPSSRQRARTTPNRPRAWASDWLVCGVAICISESRSVATPETGASRLSCGLKARRRSGRAELFHCFAEVFDRRAGGFAPFQFLAMAIDPDHWHVHFQHRGDVGRVVAADVQPAFLAADPPRALFEVDGVGLVAAHLLGGDDEVEFGPQVAARDPQQFVVGVGDDPDLVLLAEPVHRRVGLAERQPVGNAVGQELGPGRLDFPADLTGDFDDRAAQHLGVELVGAGHDFRLDFEEALEEGPLFEAETVLGRLFLAGVDDPFLPVDEGPVAIGGDPFDVFEAGQGHERARHYVIRIVCRAALLPAPPQTWTSSSTRASSCSPSTASPCPAVRSPTRLTTPSPRRSRSATPARSRPGPDR